MNRKILVVIGFCFFLLGHTITPVSALPRKISAYDRSVSNSNLSDPYKYYWTGTRGWDYVMNNPSAPNEKVNSIYVGRNYNFYELGYWVYNNQNAKYFTAWEENGVYVFLPWTDAPEGQDRYFRVNIDSAESPPYTRFYVNGSLLLQHQNPTVPDGYIIWGAEALSASDNNYAHFWDLQKRTHNLTTWTNWANFLNYNSNDHTNGYHLWRRNGSHTEGWSSKAAPNATAIHVY